MADRDPIVSLRRLTHLKQLTDRIRRGEVDLTDRQTAILMTCCLVEGPHTVKSLAAALNVNKPVVTRALNTLGSKGLARRLPCPDDRRVIYAVATNLGRGFVERIG